MNPTSTSPAVDPDAFKKAVQWAAQNPNTPQATELQKRITDGKYNETITGMGLKPEQFGYKAPAPVSVPDTRNNLEKMFGSTADALGTGIVDTGKALYKRAGDIIDTQAKNRNEDRGKPIAEQIAGGIQSVASGVISASLGGAGDIMTKMLSPFIPQDIKNNIKGKLTDAHTAINTALAEPADDRDLLHNQKVRDLVNYVETIAKDNPRLANSISDGITALSFMGGNAAEAPIKNTIESGTKKLIEGVNATRDSAGKLVEIVDNSVGEFKNAKVVARQAQAVDSLESDYNKWAGATKTGVKKLGKAEAKTEALDTAGTTGKTPSRTLAESGIIPETQGTKFRTLDQANSFRESVSPLNDALTMALKEAEGSTPPVKISDWINKSLSQISKTSMPEGERQTLQAEIRAEGQLLNNKYGDTIKLSDLNIEKQAYGKGVKFDSSKPFKTDAYYNIRKSAQTLIEDTANQAGLKEVAQLNREIGDRLSAADFLQSFDGQTLKYGKVGKYALMMTGATLGTGFVGKLLGAAGGEMLGNLLMKADVANPVKRMILRSIEQKSPEAYQQVLEWTKQQGIDKELRLALPAPGETSAPIIVPSPGILEGQQKLREFSGQTPSGIKYKISESPK